MSDAPRRRRQVTQHAADASFRLNDELIEKLKLLGYEKEYVEEQGNPRLNAFFFALEPKNPSTQFLAFQALFAWLMDEAGRPFVVDKYDDPNTTVNKMMLELKGMEFPPDFPATRLKPAFGEPVCQALSFVADAALARRGFKFEQPVYPDEELLEEAEVDEEAEVAVDSEDEMGADGEEEEEEVFYADIVRAEAAPAAGDAAAHDLEGSTRGMLVASIDPVEWKTELERVGPRLKVKLRTSGKEWRVHLEDTRSQTKRIETAFPPAQRSLTGMASTLTATLEQMEAKERYLNTQYAREAAEAREIGEKTKAVNSKFQELSGVVSEVTAELEEVTEKLDEVKARRDERSHSMTDKTPVVRIKQALTTMKSEVTELDLRIGVVGHSLMQARARHKGAVLDGDSDSDYEIDDDDEEGGAASP